MVNTPKRIGDDEIIENPDKRTIVEANKELREEQKHEQNDDMRELHEDLRSNKGLGQVLAPKPAKSDGEKKLAEAARQQEE